MRNRDEAEAHRTADRERADEIEAASRLALAAWRAGIERERQQSAELRKSLHGHEFDRDQRCLHCKLSSLEYSDSAFAGDDMVLLCVRLTGGDRPLSIRQIHQIRLLSSLPASK